MRLLLDTHAFLWWLDGNTRAPPTSPLDRMLAAQAQIERVAIISNDAVFDQYGVVRRW